MRFFIPFIFLIFFLPLPVIAEGDCGETDIASPERFRDPISVAIDNLPMGAGGTPLSTEEPFVTRDGRYLFFNSNDLEGKRDLYFAESLQGRWTFRGKLDTIDGKVNTDSEVQGNPSMDREGNFFFVDSGYAAMVRRAKFDPAKGTLSSVAAVTGPPERDIRLFSQKVHGNQGVEVSADGSYLFFDWATWRMRLLSVSTALSSDILFATRSENGFQYDAAESARLLAKINSEDLEYAESISEDGLELFFTRLKKSDLNAGKIRSAILHARRPSLRDPFEQPVVIQAIGCTDFVEGPAISSDGKKLYYHKHDGKKFRLYAVAR